MIAWAVPVLVGLARPAACAESALLVSLAHGYVGYLPPVRHHRLGGDETRLGTSRLVPGSVERLVGALVMLTRELAAERPYR